MTKTRNPPPLDPATIVLPPGRKSPYPPPHNEMPGEAEWKPLGVVLGLKNFGVNLVTLHPGAISAQRHWHQAQDEFVYVLEGELVLESNAGATPVKAGQCLGFKAGVADGHRLANRSTRPATYLVVGDRTSPEFVTYPDIDLLLDGNPATGPRWLHKDRTPYPADQQPKWDGPRR